VTPRRAPGEATVDLPPGEILSVPERVIVAPATGIFRQAGDHGPVLDGRKIDRGDVVGTVHSLGASTPVLSPFRGSLVAMLAKDGERVRPGQAIAWLRVSPS
jgi:biotin carboxyl carrier protein